MISWKNLLVATNTPSTSKVGWVHGAIGPTVIDSSKNKKGLQQKTNDEHMKYKKYNDINISIFKMLFFSTIIIQLNGLIGLF